MNVFRQINANERDGADYAVLLTDDSLAPCLPAGRTAYLRHTADLRDGDVGLFLSADGLVFRQFCQDSRGTVYLFSVDRSGRYLDLAFPSDAELPVCYGKVLLEHNPELPMD